MLIDKVKIQNFKRFEHLEVSLHSFDCLVGPNNSGKTTLLQALALFDFCLHHCLSRKNGTTELKPRTVSPEEFYVLPVASPMDLWTDRKTMANKKRVEASVELTFDNGAKVSAKVKLNYNRFGITITSTDKSQDWLAKLSDFRISYLPVFSMFLPQEEKRTSAAVEAEMIRGRVTGIIRNLLLDLKENNRHTELEQVLRRSFLDLQELAIQFDEANDRYISVTYRETDRQKEFDLFSAGSGFQQFVYLFGFTLLREPTVILLDEPDVHLHGSLQGSLLEELRQLVTAGKQVLLATHSRELITRVGAENILSLQGGSAKRLDIEYDVYDTLHSLGAVDPTQLAVLQAYRRVLALENNSDYDLIRIFCATCLGASIWQDVERRLAVCYSMGNPWKQDMGRLREQLQQMLTISGSALKMFVVADRDYHPDIQFLRQSLPTLHLDWHVWERTEIENYLLSLNALDRLITSFPLFQHPLHQEFEKLLESSRDSAYDHLLKAFQEYGKNQNKNWDVVTLSRKAREYLQDHWESEKPLLADAKMVLSDLKRWMQGQRIGQFSDRALAEKLHPEDLPAEVHDFAKNLAKFAGVTLSN